MSIIAFLIAGILVAVAASNTFYLTGKITPPVAWNGGHSSTVFFTGGDLRPSYDENGVLTGSFFLGTVGWATFNHGSGSWQAKINCPNTALTGSVNDKTLVCPVSGAAWSPNAGWIILNKDYIWSGSGVYFNPNSFALEGFGWSRSLGYIPFFSNQVRDDSNISSISWWVFVVGKTGEDFYKNITTNIPEATSVNFIGKVAVIGNIAGTRVFEVSNQYGANNQKVDYKYSSVQHAPLINTIRSNVAQLTRNIAGAEKSSLVTTPKNGFIYNDSSDYCFGDTTNPNPCNRIGKFIDINWLDINNPNIKTIIIKWHDIIIDADFNVDIENPTTPTPEWVKGIIALKGDDGKWWNIFITNAANKIYAYMVAEGSIFSWYKDNMGVHYYADEAVTQNKPFMIPRKQLYINGIAISKNTVWGTTSSSTTSPCPVLVEGGDCMKYDMNFFRNYRPADPSEIDAITDFDPYITLPASRGGVMDKIKNASVIIDYNNHIVTNPPVGFENFQ